MTRACPSRCGWQTNVKLTAWISFTLHCMSLLIAQSGHSSAHSFRTRLQAVASPADDRLPCRLSRNPWRLCRHKKIALQRLFDLLQQLASMLHVDLVEPLLEI